MFDIAITKRIYKVAPNIISLLFILIENADYFVDLLENKTNN